MVERTVTWKVLHVTKTTAEWAAVTDVITKGLLCVELTTDGRTLAKVGNGSKTFAELGYIQDGAFQIGNYYTKTETDTAIGDAIAAIGNVVTVKGVKASVEELPAEGNNAGDIWFVGADGETTDNFSEYIWTTAEKWEYLGRVQVETDLSDYYTKGEVDTTTNAIIARVETLENDTHTHSNKAILDATTASFTTEQATKLEGLENYDDTELAGKVSTLETNSVAESDVLTINCTL